MAFTAFGDAGAVVGGASPLKAVLTPLQKEVAMHDSPHTLIACIGGGAAPSGGGVCAVAAILRAARLSLQKLWIKSTLWSRAVLAECSIILSRTSEPDTGEAVEAMRMIEWERDMSYVNKPNDQNDHQS
jgi:hypothetical protein